MAFAYLIYRCGHYVTGWVKGGRSHTKYESPHDCPKCEIGLLGTGTLYTYERFVRRGKSQRWTRVDDG
jgi:hypothetical protein